MVDGVFTSALQQFTWQHENVNIAVHSLKHKLTIAAFAHPMRDSFSFQQRIDNGYTVASQEAVGEERAKMAKKTTELYIGGRLATGTDIKTTICNFRLVCMAICPEFEASELWKALSTYETILHSENGKRWINLGFRYPQVAMNLLVDIQDTINQFVQIANVTEYRTAIANEDPVSPKAYQQASALGVEIYTSLFADVQRSTLGPFVNHIPVVSEAFPHLRLQPRAGVPSSGAAARGSANQPAPKQPAPRSGANPTNPPTGDTTLLQQKGFVKWSGPGAPPICPVSVRLPAMANTERICIRFCAQGCHCGYGTRCKFAHPTGFSQIPNAPAKEAFTAYVKKTPGLDFIQGQSPPGTN
jgi:hypothetical protein